MADVVCDLPVLPKGYDFHHVGTPPRLWLGSGISSLFSVIARKGIASPMSPGPRIELLENLPGAETQTPWLNAGIKMYHFAYLVEDLDGALKWAKTQRARVTVAPVPAVAFSERHISFVIFPQPPDAGIH